MEDEPPWCYDRMVFQKPEGCEALQLAMADVGRLRGLLRRACDMLAEMDGQLCQEFSGEPDGNGEIARLRREGGIEGSDQPV